MAFLEKNELRTRDRIELIDAITESDDTIIDLVIDESIALMKSYLNGRFDVETIFAKTGDDRSNVILTFLKDIVTYRLYQIVSVEVTQTVKDGYNNAMEWLKMSAKKEIVPDLPKTADQTTYGPILYGSNTKRDNHY